MNDEGNLKMWGRSSGQILKLVVGIIIFAVLMAVRTEFERVWVRVLVAGCAGAVLGWAILQARQSKG